MTFICEFCGAETWFFAGWLAEWFCIYNCIDCPECGKTTEIPRKECLDYMLFCWRN